MQEQRLTGVFKALQKAPSLPRLVGQKADEGEAGGIEGREDERGERRICPGEDGERLPRRAQVFGDGVAGVGDDGHARIRDDAHMLALP